MVGRFRDAVDRGLDRLSALRNDVWWRGFPTLAGTSDAWVTAFVLAQLRGVDAVPWPRAETRSWLAARQGDDGGWSYGPGVPTDADSTAWVLQALGDTLTAEARDRATAFLSTHRAGDGYATFTAQSGIATYIGTEPDDIVGWTSAHPDVTAAVLLAGVPADNEARGVIEWLVARQTATGFIPSYWWRGPFYATAILLSALEARRLRLAAGPRTLLVEGMVRLQTANGGFVIGGTGEAEAFSTALGLGILCRLGDADSARRAELAAARLVDLQQQHGGWPAADVLRIPPPDQPEPDHVAVWHRQSGGGASYSGDRDGLFATALSCGALDLWLGRREQPMVTSTWPEVDASEARGDDEVVMFAR